MANTPYDDVFRTLLNDCSFLVLPMLNEVFGEHYKGFTLSQIAMATDKDESEIRLIIENE